MMKVLLWPANYFPYIGGLERLTHDLGIELKRRGHDLLVITDNPNRSEIQHDELEGINVIRFPFSTALGRGNLPLIKDILSTLEQTIEQFQPSLINAHGWYDGTSFFQGRIIERTKLPLFLTIHGLNPMHHQTAMCQRVWNQSCAINTVSNGLKDGLTQVGLTHPNLRVIFNGAPNRDGVHGRYCTTSPTASASPASSLPSPSPKHQLLCLGRLSPEKAFDTAIRAMKCVEDTHPHLRLLIAGDGEEYGKLQTLARQLGLQRRVRLLGMVHPDQTHDLIDQADIVLVTSTSESFGLVALEAAFRACPVIASDIPGLNEVVVDGETGLLIAPNDPQALADAIRASLESYAHLTSLGQAAFVRAQKTFSIEYMTSRYIELYTSHA